MGPAGFNIFSFAYGLRIETVMFNLLSLPKFALASGAYLHFSGLVNYTYCVLSASGQYTSQSSRQLEEEEE